MSEANVKQTVSNIINSLSFTGQTNLNNKSLIVQKCLEKIRILKTKLGSTSFLGKYDHTQSRAAICLEHVVRRDMAGNSVRIKIGELAKSIGMKEKHFREVKGKLDHYLEDIKVQDSGGTRASSSRNNIEDSLANPQPKDSSDQFLDKLFIKVGSQDFCDTQRASKNAKSLLRSIHLHFQKERINNIRKAFIADYKRKMETYVAACFYLECLNCHNGHRKEGKERTSSDDKNFKAKLFNDVVIAAKLNENDFNKVYSHVCELSQTILKRKPVLVTKSNKASHSRSITKRKRKLSSDEIVDTILNESVSETNFNKNESNESNGLSFSVNVDNHPCKESPTCNLLPLKNGPDEFKSFNTSKEFRRWKDRLLAEAKQNATELLRANGNMDLSKRNVLSTAADNCL